jgi:hypothetical protein
LWTSSRFLSLNLKSCRSALSPPDKQCTHNRLVRPENQLLLQLSQLENIFRLSTLNIDLGQESFDHLDNLGNIRLILTIIRCVFQNSL